MAESTGPLILHTSIRGVGRSNPRTGGGDPELDAALHAVGFESFEAYAAWGQTASPEQLQAYGDLLAVLISS